VSWMLLLWTEVALAAGGFSVSDATDQIADEGVRIAVRAVGEAWSGQNISRVYRSGVMTGGGALLIPLHPNLVVDLEATFKRVPGSEVSEETDLGTSVVSKFQLVPVSVVAEGRLPLATGGELFVGLGPSLALFKEEHSPIARTSSDADDAVTLASRTVTSGYKVAGDFRFGARFDTGLAMPSSAPVGRQLQAVEFEIFAGGRWHPGFIPRKAVDGDGNKVRQGLNLSALRGGAGLTFRY